MNATPATVVAAAGLCAGTRIDDIVTLAVLNMSSGRKAVRKAGRSGSACTPE
jgi:hypothetical protein